MLEAELNLFNQHKSDWAARFPGKFVLVKQNELIGAYDSLEAALVEGVRRFKLQPFLVRATDQPVAEIHIPALTLGLLRAHPTHSI